jgi:hypothetical protein
MASFIRISLGGWQYELLAQDLKNVQRVPSFRDPTRIPEKAMGGNPPLNDRTVPALDHVIESGRSGSGCIHPRRVLLLPLFPERLPMPTDFW